MNRMWTATRRWTVLPNRSGSSRSDLALAEGLEKNDRGGDGQIQGIGRPQHRDGDGFVGQFERFAGKAILFASQEQRHGAGQVGFPKADRRGGAGGEGTDAGLPQEFPAPVPAGKENRESEDESLAGTNDIGIVEIGYGITANDAVDSRGVRSAQDRSKIARLLHPLNHEEERIVRELGAFEEKIPLDCHADNTVRALAG